MTDGEILDQYAELVAVRNNIPYRETHMSHW